MTSNLIPPIDLTPDRIVRVDVFRVPHAVRGVRSHGIGDVGVAVETVYLRLVTEGGATGWGEAAPWAPFAGTPEASFVALNRYLRPAIMGSDPADIAGTMDRCDALLAGHWDAKAAVETALLDAAGRAAGLPVHRLLGKKVRDRIPLSLSIADPDWNRDLDLIGRAIESGIRLFKIKTGFAGSGFDRMRIEALKSMRDDLGVRVDYNQGLGVEEAMEIVPELDTLGLDFIEQPVRASEHAAMAALTERLDTPVLADESVFTAADLRRSVAERMSDGVSIKIMKCGGPKRGLALARSATDAGWRTYGGDMFESGVAHLAAMHMIACAPDFSWGCEFYHANWHLHRDVLAERFPEMRGQVVVPDTPGLGIEVDADFIQAQALETGSA